MPESLVDVERVRYTGEAEAARAIRANAWLAEAVGAAESRDGADPKRIQREFLARSLQLTEGMAPDAFRAAPMPPPRWGGPPPGRSTRPPIGLRCRERCHPPHR